MFSLERTPLFVAIHRIIHYNEHMSTIREKIKKFPQKPGVYFFLESHKKIMYIGEATSLKSRVMSYFSDDIIEKRSPLISEMVDKTKTVDYRETDSVLEALLLEASLIKSYKPYYNTEGKDDKSFNYVVITNETYPRVLVVRGRELYQKFASEDIKHLFGPFVQTGLFKEAIKLIRKIFPYYDTKQPVEKMLKGSGKIRIDFNRQIGLYPSALTSKRDYARTIRHLRMFFDGKKKQLLSQLKKEMKEYVKSEEFEKAGEIKRRIFALTHIQDVSLLKEEFRKLGGNITGRTFRIEAYDVSHMQGKDTVGVMTVVESGQMKQDEYRKFKIKSYTGANDVAGFREILERRLSHPEWVYPNLIVVDGRKAQTNAATKALDKAGIKIPVIGVVKDEHHRPKKIIGRTELRVKYEKDILLANAEAHRFAIAYHRKKRDSIR